MIEKNTNFIINWLVNCNAIEEADKDIYCYAINSFFLSVCPMLLAIGFGILMRCVKQSIILIMPFLMIRKFSGGYHTKNLWSCLLCSCLLLPLCLTLSFYSKCDWKLGMITVLATVSLILFSPIEHSNRPLCRDEKGRYKKITAILVAVFLLLDAVCFFRGYHTYAIDMSIGIILSASLQIPCIIKGLNHKDSGSQTAKNK